MTCSSSLELEAAGIGIMPEFGGELAVVALSLIMSVMICMSIDNHKNSESGLISLEVRDLACEVDYRELFSGLSFQVSNGEILQIAGHNGAGKTTLLKILAGLYEYTQGRIFWNRQLMQGDWGELAAHILFLGHKSGFRQTLSAYENLAWYAQLEGHTLDVDHFRQAMRQAGLTHKSDELVETFSAGQKQRLKLARLFLSPNSPLWILDEPFTALDSQGIAWVEKSLMAHAEAGGAIILTSHQPLSSEIPCRRMQLDPRADPGAGQ